VKRRYSGRLPPERPARESIPCGRVQAGLRGGDFLFRHEQFGPLRQRQPLTFSKDKLTG